MSGRSFASRPGRLELAALQARAGCAVRGCWIPLGARVALCSICGGVVLRNPMEAAINYYERHIGDYLKDTSHLSLLEHGIYGRLLDVYYTREGAIPDAQAARLIGARSKDEREALSAVLAEFFTLADGDWHQARCDAEIGAYQSKQAEKPASKEGAKERQRRTRERRERLFETLRSYGVTMAYNATTREIEEELSRVTNRHSSQPVTRDECVTSDDVTPHVTRHDTATQTPDTRHQTPESASRSAREPSPAGIVCKALRQIGFSSTNPCDPRLIALLEAGATQDEIVAVGEEAVKGGKGWAWLLAVVQARRNDAAAIKLSPTSEDRKSKFEGVL